MIEKGVHYTREILKEMRERKYQNSVLHVSGVGRASEKEWMVPVTPNGPQRSPSQCEGLHAVIQTAGPLYTPSALVSCTSNVIALKFERKVQESAFILAVDGNNDGDREDSDFGAVTPRAMTLEGHRPIWPKLKAPAFTRKVTGNVWDSGCKTETQPKWLFLKLR